MTAALVAALGLGWLEGRRLDRALRGRRIAAAVAAVVSLALLAARHRRSDTVAGASPG
jgi:hypothetical protein